MRKHSQRPQVASRIGGHSSQLLGRHVQHRPDLLTGLRQLRLRLAHEFCHAEVEDFDRSRAGDQDVRGLDVPMNDSSAVRNFQPERDLPQNSGRFINREASFFQALLERLALVQGHHDE